MPLAQYPSNFLGNTFRYPPDMSHYIFSAHIVDRKAYKSLDWIIDIGRTYHMVHSVSLLTTITSTINTFVYLPNGLSKKKKKKKEKLL